MYLMYESEIECYIFVVQLPINTMWRPENHGSARLFFRIHDLQTFILWEKHILTTTYSLCNGEIEHRTGCFKKFKFAGVSRGCPGYVEGIETLNRVDRYTTSTLEIGREYFYVIIKPPPISFTLYRTQENVYGHITEFWSRVDVRSTFVDMNKYWD